MESGPFRVKISVLCSGELCKCLRWGLPPYQQSVVYSKWPSWPKVDVQVTNRGDWWYFHLYESVVIRREWFQWDYQSSRHRWFDHLHGHIGNPHPGGCPDSPSRERIGSLGSLCWSRFPMRNKWSKSLLHRLFCRGRKKKSASKRTPKILASRSSESRSASQFPSLLPFASDEIRCAFLPPVGTDVRAVKVFPHIKKTPLWITPDYSKVSWFDQICIPAPSLSACQLDLKQMVNFSTLIPLGNPSILHPFYWRSVLRPSRCWNSFRENNQLMSVYCEWCEWGVVSMLFKHKKPPGCQIAQTAQNPCWNLPCRWKNRFFRHHSHSNSRLRLSFLRWHSSIGFIVR